MKVQSGVTIKNRYIDLYLFLKSLSFILLFNLLFSINASAAGGVVKALQMPAWLERDGVATALKPGVILQQKDKIITGKNARMLIQMNEGSLIKLGEKAELNFDALFPAEEAEGFFEATLRLVKGAFRFTTTELGKTGRRNVNVRIGSITAGIRGTDIWGSSKLDTDLLCLIEGNITAQRAGEPEFEMNEPLSFYVVPKNKPALPVSPVDSTQLTEWANETELANGMGVLSVNGKWSVNLMSLASEVIAKSIKNSLTTAGFAVEIEKALVNGKNWYRLRISNFKSREDASAFAKKIEGRNGITQPWIIQF